MPENLPTHSHCLECDSAIPVGAPYCSKECESAHTAKAKKERLKSMLFAIAAIVAIIALALMSGLI
jgi:predicted nucleic acid-binding Zn ribbon protein